MWNPLLYGEITREWGQHIIIIATLILFHDILNWWYFDGVGGEPEKSRTLMVKLKAVAESGHGGAFAKIIWRQKKWLVISGCLWIVAGRSLAVVIINIIMIMVVFIIIIININSPQAQLLQSLCYHRLRTSSGTATRCSSCYHHQWSSSLSLM